VQINLNSLFVPNVGSLGSSSSQAQSTGRDRGRPPSFALGLAQVWWEGEVLEQGRAWLRHGGAHAQVGHGPRAHQ